MKAIWGVEAKRGMVASAYLHPATKTISVTDHRTAEVHPVADPDAAHALLERMGLSVIDTDALLRLKARGRASDAPRRAASGKRDPDTGNPRLRASGGLSGSEFFDCVQVVTVRNIPSSGRRVSSPGVPF